MTARSTWGRPSRDPADPDRGLLKDFPFFAGKKKGAAPEAGTAHQALELLQAFEGACHGWFWSVDQEGCLTYISDSVAQSLGATSAQLLGQPFSDFLALADDDRTGRRALPFVLAKRSPFEKVMLRPAKSEQARCWAVSGTPQFDAAGHFTGYLGSAIDVTEQRSSSERATQLARYDALTGLPNRRRMAELLDSDLAGAEHHHRPCAVMLIDLDRFKQVNDTLGHPAGDALLKQVAERLAKIVGDKERTFRLGGDEFQVIMPNCEDRGVIGELASNVIASLSQPYSVEGSRCTIGASIGVAVAPVDGRSRTELIRNADLALYASKAGGRGRFRFFSTDLLKAAEDKRALEEDLRDALARGEMSLAYQPVVNARSNQITGVEALLRWNHPSRGSVSPALFVPIAEEAGIVGQLGDWALRQACADAATWPGKLRVAVNVSPVQFNGEALPATIMSALAASGLSPDRLELEITEGVLLGDTASADAMFAALKEIGVRLALDDFGTGYSSLGYLRTAPFDKIKIDQTFVREATQFGSRNGAIIAAIVALAEALEMETTAEGIEYMDQLELMRGLRVSHVQGWVYSKALASAELALRLQDGDWMISPSGPATQRSSRQSVYRKVGVIHGNRYRSVVMRNLSATGALIEGHEQLPLQALIVIDFGDGQLTFARVARITGRQLGVIFEHELVDDGNGGLCTPRRVSPYTLATLGLPSPGQPDKEIGDDTPAAFDELAQRMGLQVASRPQRSAPLMNLQWSSAFAPGHVPTFGEISERYLESLLGDEQACDSARRDLHDHILPQFGQLRLDQVNDADILTWLGSTGEAGPAATPDSERLKKLLGRMWTLAIDLKLVDAESNPLAGSLRFDRRGHGNAILSTDEAQQLLLAARASPNRQLRSIIALLMLTGARTGEILNVQWDHLDLSDGIWRVHVAGAETLRDLRLNGPALDLLRTLPRFPDCCYVVPNPATKKAYRSLTQSWDVVKVKAMLPHLELDDLRYCDLGAAAWQERLLGLLRQENTGARAASEPRSCPAKAA